MRKRIVSIGSGFGTAGIAGTAGIFGASATAQEPLPEQVEGIVGSASEKLTEIAGAPETVTASETVLDWIGWVATLYHPWVNWLLVAVGISLFVSHVGQLVVGKLWVALRHKGWSWGEILNDLLVVVFAGLALPAVLIIPAGYGAFASSPLSVLSAAATGVLFGAYLYTHGMRQEALAKRGREDRGRGCEGRKRVRQIANG